jgi:hypothetical protein
MRKLFEELDRSHTALGELILRRRPLRHRPQSRRREAAVFAAEWAEPVVFQNPLQNTEVMQTVYVGVSRGEHAG